jgi:mannose-1-phosphate guanylyltransferase/mannose-6-phosphate isomerase
VWRQADRDESGNAASGNVKIHSGTGNFVYSENALTAVVGVDNLVVVVTGDAALVVSRDRLDEVDEVVRGLSALGAPETELDSTVFRPWGKYEILASGENYLVKRLTIAAGGRLSLQRHEHRSEHWVVVRGRVSVSVDGKDMTVRPNESVYVQRGTTHRLENCDPDPAEIIEVQTGDYLAEDDIVRLDDIYGRS